MAVLTPNLGLIVDSDITATSRQNLYKLDQLGQILTPLNNGDTLFSADADLRFETEHNVSFGTDDVHISTFTIHADTIAFHGTSSITGLVIPYTTLDFTGSSLTSILDQASVIAANPAVAAATAHIASTSNPHVTTAAQVGAYTIAQTDALLALKLDASTFASHIALTGGVHGVSGAVVGTTDSQTLINKTIVAGSNLITGITNAMIADSAAIAYSKLNLGNSILRTDIATAVAGTNGQALTVSPTGTLQWSTIPGMPLSEGSIIIGNASSASIAVDTSTVGEILANVTTGLTIKSKGDLSGVANRTSVTGGTGAVLGTGASVDINTTLLPSPGAGDVGKALLSTGANAATWQTISTADEKLKVSSDDTTAGYLDGKLTAGTGISLTVGSPAGNETLAVANTDKGSSAVSAHELAYPHGILTAQALLTGPGFVVKTSTDPAALTYASRSIAGTTNRVSVSNGDGVSTNPTINIDTSLLPSPASGDVGKALVSSGANAASWSVAQVNVDQAMSGLVSWGGSGNYYSLVSGTFTVLRAGTGRIAGTKISWAGGESVSGLTAGKGYIIGYSATNTLTAIEISTLADANDVLMISKWSTAYTNNVILFGVWMDGAYPQVVKDDHEYKFATPISVQEHFRFGQTFTFSGASLTVLDAANRLIQTSGEDMLSDHGLNTRILDNPGVSLNPQPIFMNASGAGQRLAPHRFTVSGITTAPLAGAVYSQGTSQFTVLYTTLTGVAPNISGTIATWMNAGTVAPTASGALTKVSGTGDNTVNYSSFLIPASIAATYAPAGIPTSLGTGGANRYGIVAIYATKDDKQTPSTAAPAPYYFQLLSTTAYNSTANAANSIGSAIVPDMTQFVIPSEFKALELTLNGFVICDGNGRVIPVVSTNGFVAGVKTVKATLSAQFTAGAVTATTANNVSTDTTTFTSGWLTTADANVQLALNTIETKSVNFPVSGSGDVGLPLVTSSAGVASWALPQSTIDLNQSGFVSWGGSGNYYSFVPSTGVFTVLRSGVGRIKSLKKTWAGGENVTLTRGKSYMVHLTDTNTIAATDWRSVYSADVATYMENMHTLFKNNVCLFSIFYDSIDEGYGVIKQSHPYDYASEIAAHDHFRLGHTFIGSGGLISVLSATGRTIQTTGNAALDDHGIITTVASAPGSAMTINCVYNNATDTLSMLQRRAFTISVGTPVAGDVYRDAGDTFRVKVLYFSDGVMHAWQTAGTVSPPAGTTSLTRVSGTGSDPITYTSYVDVRTIPPVYVPTATKTPTVLAPSGNTNRWGLLAIFATADDLQTPSTAAPVPRYIAVPGNAAYNTAATAIAALGTAAIPDMSIFVMPVESEALEPCLMGFVLIDGNGASGTGSIGTTTSAGFVSGVRSYRNTGSGTGGAGAAAVSTALNVSTSTTNFVAAGGISSILSVSDINVQTALDTLAKGAASRYVAALSWTGAGPYTMTITGATHLRGTDPIVRVRQLVTGSTYVVVLTDTQIDDSNGDVVLTSSENITGKVVIL